MTPGGLLAIGTVCTARSWASTATQGRRAAKSESARRMEPGQGMRQLYAKVWMLNVLQRYVV